MLKKLFYRLIIVLLVASPMYCFSLNFNKQPLKSNQMTEQTITPEEFLKNISWFGQASVKFTYNGLKIYIDPLLIKNKDTADIILITHVHGDHLSLKDMDMIYVKGKTQIIAAAACAEKINKHYSITVKTMLPNEQTTINTIKIEAVPSYNVVKTQFHPKEYNFLGYILTFGDVRVYHTGDTERIPEMANMKCDIIMLPLGQTYTMNNVDEAVQCVLDVKAKIAIPIHYGLYEGKVEDSIDFEKKLQGKVKVVIKKQGE